MRPKLAIGVGGLAVLLGALDAYVLVSLLVQIISDMGVPVNHLERATPLVTGYLLGYIAGMPLLGRISDRYGRRLVILLCLFGFAAGSLITATATDMGTLIAGRAIQGLAGGALLPVTLALVADVFAAEKRSAALGWVGAAQELGAVLGPIFGAAVAVWLDGFQMNVFGDYQIGPIDGWRGIFWLNLPLALLAAIAVAFAVPKRTQSAVAPRVDFVGGFLLAVSLGLFVVGLYNPEPDKSFLPPWGANTLIGGGVALLLFIIWETFARTKLLDTSEVRMRPFLASLVASLCAGAALLVTLVDVQLVAQTLLGKDSMGGTLLLTRFLVALPIGALLGGVLMRWLGEWLLTFFGMMLAAAAYWQIANWPADILGATYTEGLSRLDVDLAVAGLGLGLVIAPLSAIVLRVAPASQHGIASAAVVVARMMGMLIGVAALSAWGLYRFHEFTRNLVPPVFCTDSPEVCTQKMNAYTAALQAALRMQYKEIFLATAAICVLGALFGLLLATRRKQALDHVS